MNAKKSLSASLSLLFYCLIPLSYEEECYVVDYIHNRDLWPGMLREKIDRIH